jgi:CheY-like chemotaxis protein
MQKRFFVPPTEKTHELSDLEEPEFKSVLLLEDEGAFTEMVRTVLESNHYRVTAVKNGVEGLKKIMASDFDLVLCDMMMPTLPGDMFYLAVQRTKPDLCKRFVFMTGHRGERKIDEFIRKVKGVILWKPFQPHELLDTLRLVEKKAGEKK